MPTPRKVHLRTILFRLIAIPLCALLFALTYGTYRQYEDGVADAYRTASIIRSMYVEQTEQFLARAKFILFKLSQRPQVQLLDPSHCDPVLKELKALEPNYANVFTLDTDGQLVCSATEVRPGAPVGPDPRHYFAELKRSGQFTVGQPAHGFLSGRLVSTLSYPIRDETGALSGVAAIAVDLLKYQPIIPQEGFPPETVIGIINSEGILIARSENADLQAGMTVKPELIRTLRSEREGTVELTDSRGRSRFYAFGPIVDSDWFVVASIDNRSVISPIISLVWRRLVFILVLVLLLLYITIRSVRRIANSVEQISSTMARVEAGAVHERAILSGPLELHQIAAQMNSMLDARMSAEVTVRQSEERFRTAFNTSPDAIAIIRLEDWQFLEVNDHYTSMTGWDREEVIGKTAKDLRIWRDWEDRKKMILPLQHNGACINLEADFVSKDGHIWNGEVSAHLMTLDGVPCFLVSIRDVTDRNAARQKIHNLSFSDSLTGLPNRQLFLDRLVQAIGSSARNQRQGGLIFVDLDDFRSINETLGHDQGDLLLIEVARRLRACMRGGDTVARLGADEFVVLMKELSANPRDAATEAEALCEKVLSVLRQPYLLAGRMHHRTCSVGISIFGKQDDDAIQLLEWAQLAMNQVKNSGRNALQFFDPQMQAAVTARAEMERGLREAIGNHEIQLHYQPQVTNEGHVIGVEALVRWEDPRVGMISPAEFIPLAESSNLIFLLGQRVLEIACQQLALWSRQPEMAHLSIAVNVSTSQFHQKDFVHQVLSVLKRTGANPLRLKLEITESMLVANVQEVITKMNILKDIGIEFSLDDFGTGYASLAYLKRLPLMQLKIDQSFVRDILIDPNDVAIARMIITLSASMGLLVIAEGVETQAQHDKLSELGCMLYQGYFFSRPLRAQAVEGFVKKGGPSPW